MRCCSRHVVDPLLVQLLGAPEEEGNVFDPYVTRVESIAADNLGRPNANPPTATVQDNIQVQAFTLNTDRAFLEFPVPFDLHAGGIFLGAVWTNDGGTDDNGKTVKWQFDYQLGKRGQPVSGSHANSPRSVQDTYESTLGWIEHHADYINIPDSELVGMECVFMKISAVTPTGTQLSCEPHLIGICKVYTATRLA